MTKKRYISDEDRLMMDTTVKWTSSAIIDNGPKNIENFLLKGELEKDFIIKDIPTNGCGSGVISELIYYSDINKFYDTHHIQIWEELEELGGLKWLLEGTREGGPNSPPSSDAHFKCLLTWVAVENVACRILNNREKIKEEGYPAKYE